MNDQELEYLKMLCERKQLIRLCGVQLTEKERLILSIFLRRDWVSRELLHFAIYGTRPECDQPKPSIVDVHLCHMRKKLPVTIVNTVNEGWHIGAADKQKLMAMAC